jgi:hypothetical protein
MGNKFLCLRCKYGSLEFATSALLLLFLAVCVYLLLLQIGQVGLRDNVISKVFSNLMDRLLMTVNPTTNMMTDLSQDSQPLSSHAVGKASMICSPMLPLNNFFTIWERFVREARDILTLNTCSWLSFTSTKEVWKVMAKMTIHVLGGRIGG